MHNVHDFLLYAFWLNVIGLLSLVRGPLRRNPSGGAVALLLIEVFGIAWSAILLWG